VAAAAAMQHDLPAREGQMGDAAGGADGLHPEAFFQSLQPVPEPLPAAKNDRHHHDVQVIDQVRGQDWRIVDGPPPMRTSRPPAASRAASSASAGLASMN